MKRNIEILCAQNWIEEVIEQQGIMELSDCWDGSTYVYACLARGRLGGPLWKYRYDKLSDKVSMIE